jgi:hypothetical protein
MDLHFEHENFFHPSIVPYKGKLMLIMHKILAMDNFSVPYYCFSKDGGKTWSTPLEITPLKQFAKCADFRPIVQVDDSKVGIIGIVKGESGYQSVYLFYDGKWSSVQYLPNQEAGDDRTAGAQCAIFNNNCVIIPSFHLNKNRKFVTVTRKYAINDNKLDFIASSNELTIDSGRGLYEPSVIDFNGKFYLTLRCDENCAFVTCSSDGLTWENPKKWYFSNGEILTTSPTQQHWMKLNGKIYLVYTRKDVDNSDCFRWRTPLFAAPVDVNNLTLNEKEEITILPRIDYKNRPGLYGNFNVSNYKNIVYISDAALWFDWTQDKQAIEWFSTSVIFNILTY